MGNDFEKYNEEAQPIDAFELLSKHGRDKNLEALFPMKGKDAEEAVDLDWERLTKIATRKSLFERIWASSLRFGNKQLAIYVTLSVVLSPLVLLLTYHWASMKLPALNTLQNIKVTAILIFVLSMVVLVLSSIVYILFERFPISNKAIRIPALEKRHTLSSVLVGVFMVAIIGGFYNFASRSQSKLNPNYIHIGFEGKNKVIDSDFKALFSSESTANKMTLEYTKILDSVKNSGVSNPYLSQGPEFYNAIAVFYEREGDLIKAQEAYKLAEKSDPFVEVVSYKLNNYPERSSLEQWREELNLGQYTFVEIGKKGKRVVSSKDAIIFSDKESVESFLQESHDCDSTGKNTLSCYNTQAVALEFLQKDLEAKALYSKLLEKERYDPTVLFNVKENLDLMSKGN